MLAAIELLRCHEAASPLTVTHYHGNLSLTNQITLWNMSHHSYRIPTGTKVLQLQWSEYDRLKEQFTQTVQNCSVDLHCLCELLLYWFRPLTCFWQLIDVWSFCLVLNWLYLLFCDVFIYLTIVIFTATRLFLWSLILRTLFLLYSLFCFLNEDFNRH